MEVWHLNAKHPNIFHIWLVWLVGMAILDMWILLSLFKYKSLTYTLSQGGVTTLPPIDGPGPSPWSRPCPCQWLITWRTRGQLPALYWGCHRHIRMRSPCTLNRLLQTRCLSGQAHAKLAGSRRTRSRLAIISWATQPDSQRNRGARNPLFETRNALGYPWRWRVTTRYEECISSLLRGMRVYYEFKRVWHELQRVATS